jgi:hypothetical protein
MAIGQRKSIDKNDRQHFMSLMQELVFAETVDIFDAKESPTIQCCPTIQS